MNTPKELALLAARALSDKKGREIQALEIADLSTIADYFVIATGGSVVYGEEAMRHLKRIGTVIYLKLSCAAIEERLGDLHARGVSIQPGWTLRDLYNERCPMYEQWADIVVDCERMKLREVVDAILRQMLE